MTDRSLRDWAAIRAAYENGTETLAAIARAHGVSLSGLRGRAKREAWPPRERNDKPKRAAAGRTQRSETRSLPGSRRRKPLPERLMEAINMQLDRLERRVVDPSDLSSADCEREARALHGLVRNFEALEAMAAAPPTGPAHANAQSQKTPKAQPKVADPDLSNDQGSAAHEQDSFRRDVAARIIKLRDQLSERGE